jgi:hypothetical protein
MGARGCPAGASRVSLGLRSHLVGLPAPLPPLPKCYPGTVVTIERVQTGLRIERTTLKVLKGLAEYLDVSLGDLVEGIVWHAFDGKTPFEPPTLAVIDQLKAVYGLTLTAADAHTLKEEEEQQ